MREGSIMRKLQCPMVGDSMGHTDKRVQDKLATKNTQKKEKKKI